MLTSLRQQAWRRINVTFPERQIYIRSDGRVQFFTFDPMMQAILAVPVSCSSAGGIHSVNVIFKRTARRQAEMHADRRRCAGASN